MQAMILAAGLGKRMLPLTSTIPKPLLKVKGQPLIVHLIQSLKEQGVNRIIINIYHFKEQIKRYLKDGRDYGVEIVYSEEQELLNTGGGIVNALSLLKPEPFIVVSADLYTTYPFASLSKSLTKSAHLVLVDNPSFNVKGDFSLHDGIVCEPSGHTLTYANLGIFTHEIFHNPPAIIFPLNVLLKMAITNNMVTGERFTGIWHNIGTPQLLQTLEKL